MLWILFALTAALAWAIVDLIDKYVVCNEVKDPIYATVVSGLVGSLILIALSFFSDTVLLSVPIIVIALLSGAMLRAGVIVYYRALESEEVSRIAPVLCSESLFVLLFALLFFGELFTPMTYIGVLAIVLGAVLISTHLTSMSINKGVLLAFSAAIIFALRTIMIKFGTENTGLWSLLFWIGLGQLLVSGLLLLIHHNHVMEISRHGVLHLSLGAAISQVGFISFILALASGPVTLVAALVQVQPFIVFFIVTASSFYFPKIMREDINRRTIVQKFLAISLVCIGLILIL